ncbi:probable protein N-terminal and lysine N-methyltransferase EFM7 at N-terminal half [Coccomyxa sp. Obi]|nr:probable protein N-terminal and lysine N-methyltransferase EFM7 at N-terminal half [Coccomyxa sp. Obi]
MAALTLPLEEAEEDKASLESDFIDLLIASERVGTLVDRIKDVSCFRRRRQAVFDLAAAVEKKESFVVEARQAGAVDLLTSLLKKYSDDEELVQKACSIITACSGTLSCSGKVHQHTYGPVTVTVKEGTLVDGLGARVWAVAHSLCSMLVQKPALVQKKTVLEIGAGTGLCGIVAAKLGAAQVTLTDYEGPVLRLLRESVAANASCAAASSGCPLEAEGISPDCYEVNDLEFDPEDAEECDDLDDFLLGAGKESASKTLYWDLDNMRVRHMDWNDDLDRLQGKMEPNGEKKALRDAEGEVVPDMDVSETFDVILGSDILYEMAHADLVASVLKLRLRIGGMAFLSMAVRDQAILDRFICCMGTLGMSVEREEIRPSEENKGILGLERDYEGGFAMLTIEHLAK